MNNLVGSAMLNWRYVGKTFVYRDIVREKIRKMGPITASYRYVERNDICFWKNAPKYANNTGRILWLSDDEKYAKVFKLNQHKFKGDEHAVHKRIPVTELVLVDVKGNPSEHCTVAIYKDKPVRISEHGYKIPYPDEVVDLLNPKKDLEADTTQADLDMYGANVPVLEDIESDLEANLNAKIEDVPKKGRLRKMADFITKK